jgi:hypothetical protein
MRPGRRCPRDPREAPGQHQTPGRGVDQERAAVAEVTRPLSGAQLVADQPVGRVGVGDTEQRLRKAHQHDALARAEPILLQERLYSQLIAARAADAPGKLERARPDARPGRTVDGGKLQQLGDAGRLVGAMRGADPGPVRIFAERWPVSEEMGAHVPTPRCWPEAGAAPPAAARNHYRILPRSGRSAARISRSVLDR